jgi:hypothetical protein
MLSTPKLTKNARFISWFAMVNGVLCLASPFLLAFISKVQVNLDVATIYLVSAAVTFSAGFFGLKRQQWAFWLLCLFFALQLIEYMSEKSIFSLIGPVSLKIGFVWANPPAKINFNLFALLVVVFAGRAAIQISEQDSVASGSKSDLKRDDA